MRRGIGHVRVRCASGGRRRGARDGTRRICQLWIAVCRGGAYSSDTLPRGSLDQCGFKIQLEAPMRRIPIAMISSICIGALASCSSQQPAPPPTAANPAATEGTVTFSGGAVAVGIGYQWGNGTLTFQGRQYAFRMTGLSVVDVGV